MLTKILAASALTIGLATAALAQDAGAYNANTGATSGTHQPRHHARRVLVDPSTTSSIGIVGTSSDYMNSNADQNCPAGPQGANPETPNASGRPPKAPPSVNGHHCGQ
ncbi:hypothetical protein FJ934_16205 [Mesorhizobium sp. B2-4-12]|uniref:hypothetical protein n=2 Tax=Mesorhizobium TaxID=68287 RepID=UPI00112E9825|nr:hypothetical protein [Mesorhizobium sp. B4-1-4]TPK90316.1 hypothetical protein FJ548_07940 [Mesorhizobium sp. B2-4-17]TPK94076.1 hypothetical protein FJ934_16205 [Mesorhizobium sp. B2-4-12]TPL10273.1 hypothetical protein FJ938_05375 [Mesorhizobium sp. B2-4-14]UCI30893.1 hypothetical protein FJW03_24380 [Mesorhizobium sp. B4-1-4]